MESAVVHFCALLSMKNNIIYKWVSLKQMLIVLAVFELMLRCDRNNASVFPRGQNTPCGLIKLLCLNIRLWIWSNPNETTRLMKNGLLWREVLTSFGVYYFFLFSFFSTTGNESVLRWTQVSPEFSWWKKSTNSDVKANWTDTPTTFEICF